MITLVAFDLNGKRCETGEVKSFSVSADMEFPVRSIRLLAGEKDFCGKLREIELYSGGETLFKGEADYIKNTADKNGTNLYIEGRSSEKILLDNEAMPEVLWGANLATIFKRYVGKFGFAMATDYSGENLPVYTVGKGTSYWEAFVKFASSLYGMRPYMERGVVYCKEPALDKAVYRLSNRGEGLKYTSFTKEYLPYEIISGIYIRNSAGEYLAKVENPEQAYYKTQRERYHIPNGENSHLARIDALARIKQSVRKSMVYKVEIPELMPVQLGKTVEVADKEIGENRLIIKGYEFGYSSQGFYTKLTLM